MSTSSKGKVSKKEVISQARQLADRVSASREESASTEMSAAIQENPYAQVMFNTNLSPEAKRDEIASLVAFDSEATKEQNRERIEAFHKFMEYLQEQRKVLNREGIKLQDTEAFAQLQGVIDQMSAATIEFQDKVEPLMEVLQAVFEIRKNNKVTEVYKDIQDDIAWLEEQEAKLAELEENQGKNRRNWMNLEKDVSFLSKDKGLFGFGPVRAESQAKIDELRNFTIPDVAKQHDDLVEEIKEQKALLEKGREGLNPELRAQKETLRQFLDLTNDENRGRQKDLIDAAVNYVDTSDGKLKNVLGTLERLGKHSEVVGDSNSMLRNFHLIMDDSLKHANQSNQGSRDSLASSPTGESSIARMTREEQLKDLNEHIARTDEGAVDIANSIGGLTKQSVQIQAYKDTIRNETGSTKRLHLEGVSQMAEQLMSVISAISSAATTESRAVAASNFAEMAEQNQIIVSQEVIKNATNVDLEAKAISKLVGELEDYGQVLNASSEIATQGYDRMRETVDAIRKVSGSVQGAIDDFVSDRADAGIAVGEDEKEKTVSEKAAKEGEENSDFSNPFGKLGG